MSKFTNASNESNMDGTSDSQTPVDRLKRILRPLTEERMGFAGLVILVLIILMAIFAPVISPYEPSEKDYFNTYQPPSLEHPMGTDNAGRDILSQLFYASRPALLIGFIVAASVTIIGTSVGVTAGFYGGRVDDFLMRIVDLTYGIPLLPFIILLIALWDASITVIVGALSALLWRSTSRVVRASVLSIKQKEYIKSARTAGASNARIMLRHIVPNVLPLSFLYGSFAIAWAILTEANLSYLGFGDPTLVTWGKMLLLARQSQALARDAWWWFLAPGFMIMLTVISTFAIGRGYEKELNPELKE